MIRGRFAAWLALVLASTFAACRPRGAVEPSGAPVILISIDTLRSDHLPAYGYGGVATPAIDALRRDGVLFERAYAHVPLTLPSHASLLSGLLPTRNGVRDNVGYTVETARSPCLPCLLRQAGYATGAAVSSFVLRRETGIAGGFDFYDSDIRTRAGRGIGGLQRAGMETLGRAVGWLREPHGVNRFLWLHLYEPHAPYAPPEPFASRYASSYDGEIAAADAVVGELLAELRRLGLYDAALVVLVADHGEGLGEHGEDGHGALLYRHDLQVPLILKLPRAARAGAVVSRPVGLVDVAPTVLEVVGLPVPPAFDGTSLLAERRPPGGIYSETYAPRLHYGWSELTSWIDDRHHLIAGPDPELYDLAGDPRETANLRLSDRRTYALLRAALDEKTAPLEAPRPVDDEARRELAALGYLGQARAVAAGENLPDPKAMLGTLATLERGLELFARQETAEAVDQLRRAAAENPRMVDAWDYLGRSYQRLGQPQRALAAYRRALDLAGGHPEVALGTARALVEIGRPDEALALLRDQAAKAPSDRRLPLLEVRLLLLRGELAAARELGGRILSAAPEDADAWYARGAVAMAERSFHPAEEAFRRALALQPDHPAALNDLGVLLAAQHRDVEAVSLLERLTELQPANEPARRSLLELRARHTAGGG